MVLEIISERHMHSIDIIGTRNRRMGSGFYFDILQHLARILLLLVFCFEIMGHETGEWVRGSTCLPLERLEHRNCIATGRVLWLPSRIFIDMTFRQSSIDGFLLLAV
jgi:hypothetical protein